MISSVYFERDGRYFVPRPSPRRANLHPDWDLKTVFFYYIYLFIYLVFVLFCVFFFLRYLLRTV